jgi:predicted nucleotidyltransferase
MTSRGSTVGAELRRTLDGYPSIDSAALYGSVARGDVEPHSDVDLLVVCCGSVKERLYLELASALSGTCRNLSISLYSPSELLFMKRVGSLFLLHLRNEGILLFDRSGSLTKILREFVPKPSYKSDFEKSLALLAPMRTAVCGSPNQLHRLAQIYALFRVFGVYLLAERGIFEFSKKKMTAILAGGGGLNEANVDRLSKLRVLNANFFTGGGHLRGAATSLMAYHFCGLR